MSGRPEGTETWLCLGYVHLHSLKIGVEFCMLNEDDTKGTQTLLYAKKVGTCYAGHKYELTFNDTGMLLGKPKLLAQWATAEERYPLVLESRAVETEFNVQRRNKKAASSHDTILDCLKPLRSAYHSTNAAGQAAIIAQIIQFMQKRWVE